MVGETQILVLLQSSLTNILHVRKYDYRPQHRHRLKLASLSGTASKHLKSAYLLGLHLLPFYHQGERKPCLPVLFLAFWKSQGLKQRQLSASLHMHSHIFITCLSPSLPCVCRQQRVAVSISSYPHTCTFLSLSYFQADGKPRLFNIYTRANL